jgi:hypothetical protein
MKPRRHRAFQDRDTRPGGFWRGVALVLLWPVAAGLTIWAIAALFIDGPAGWQIALAIAYAVLLLAALVLVRGSLRKPLLCIAGFCLVLLWWVSISPSNTRDWQKDVDRTAWADIEGDQVTIHNLRNFNYRSEFDYDPNWETRTYDLSKLEGADISITFWGSPWIAHPIISFRFSGSAPLAISVETRKVTGQEYSAIRGFFRQYELIYILADERDVLRLRTNYRTGEEVYLYHTNTTPAAARAVLLDYLREVNELHAQPRFYNALTSNCTSNIRIHTAAAGNALPPWDWRLLLNGKSDEFAYQYGRIVDGGLPFLDLKRQAHINDAARAADQAPDFSARIRAGRVGF